MSSRSRPTINQSGEPDDYARAAEAKPGQRRVSLYHAPVEDITLEPREETREVEDLIEEEEVKKLVIPHVHIREEFQEVDVTVRKPRYLRQPKVEVLHRKIEIPKPVKQQQLVEMPQLHVVDRITEKYEDIVKEKLVEKPKYIIQERIVPIPKRKIEEHTVRVPREAFDKIVQPMENQKFETITGEDGQPEVRDLFNGIWKSGRAASAQPGMKGDEPKKLGGPKYRHLPRPVEVPMLHYKPVPIERLVDRNVPVPVEMNITQEFQCPVLIPTWSETAVPINVTRVIEKPVPADAFSSKALMSLYLNQTQDIDREADERDRKNRSLFSSCKGGTRVSTGFPVMNKMSEVEIRAAGIDTNYRKLKSFDSYGYEKERRVNASTSIGFFTEDRGMLKDKTASEVAAMKPEGGLAAN